MSLNRSTEFKKENDFHPLIQKYFAAIDFLPTDSVLKLETVEQILHKHGLTFAMTTFPANKQDKVELNFENVASYLLENRYGFCFHHNTTVYEALKALGFNVHLIAGTIRKAPDFIEGYEVPAHVAILLNFAGQRYLLDPGFSPTVSKPMLLEVESSSEMFSVSKLSSTQYGFIEKPLDASPRCRYDFTCTPVQLNDFAPGLKSVMSQDYPFATKFLYLLRKPNGDLASILNRKYTCADAKGAPRLKFDFHQPGSEILKQFFSFPAQKAQELSEIAFPNKAVRKMVNEFNLPAKAHLNIFSFLSIGDKARARQIASEWNIKDEITVSLKK